MNSRKLFSLVFGVVVVVISNPSPTPLVPTQRLILVDGSGPVPRPPVSPTMVLVDGSGPVPPLPPALNPAIA